MKLVAASSIILGAMVGISSGVFAEEEPVDKRIWSGGVSLSVLTSNGNTSNQNLALKSRAVRDGELWKSTFKLEGVNESTEDVRTAEKYFGSMKLDRKLSDVDYVFALLEHEDDSFSTYDYQSTFSAGYGRKIIDSDHHKLDLEVGPGYRHSMIQDGNEIERESTLRGAVNYNWAISEGSSFREELSVDGGEDLTIGKSVTEFKTKLRGSLSLTISYEIKVTSIVVSEEHKFDSSTLVALDYSF